MAIDKKVHEAIDVSVKNNHQSDNAAKRIINWLEHLSEGNASLNSKEDVKDFIESILDAIEVEDKEDDSANQLHLLEELE